MDIQVRYYTRSGNTQKLAEAIAAAVGATAENIEIPLKEKADILFLGCSYYAFDVDEAVKKFVLENKEKIGKIFCFGTSAMMKSTRKPMKKVADEAGVYLASDEFHCRGSFWKVHKGRPNEADLKSAAEFAKKVLKGLEAKGYVRRCRSSEDERVLMVEITENGEKLKEQAVDIPEKVAG
ncbi:MAG: flavodoxin [Clostridia bacterium]|nr:flavodoxin [Clostridia bacterium]